MPDDPPDDLLRGISLTAMGYGMFSVQDAAVKWLVADYSVPQVLFLRSLVIVLIACTIGGRSLVRSLAGSQMRSTLVARAVLVLVAWLSFYTAARKLSLPQLTTLYFAAPIIVVALSAPILKERVGIPRWTAVLVGFVGVLLAAKPGRGMDPLPTTMALFAAVCWGLGSILARIIVRTESTSSQMLVVNGVFAIACGAVLPWIWVNPDPFSLALMVGLGLAGGAGQFLIFEGYRFAPASVVAPLEYTGLVWAFLYGYLIWGDFPQLNVIAGALLIVGSSLGLIWTERRRAARPSA